ncbi:MAG: DNA polymerase IV [Rhodoferax sp.]|nr:DNA polymerase IV [Betaproteobacteria bacterium]NCN96157.1 DNA polymerase IV [Rhodoferax sp.]OIP17844.1 MAG: DNA polymerase IV [Comamonadaceae bacterium CG2_30_57_122]PIZ22166.1 MAG: DNA polymerase IV [Comamonadaceae bacterium CG_4_10_14_0_8_um_filter_57_29]PJC22089.1 MAG: DNA polymerase IV [Comamonadaceae bacterium CG_4_9_14_0_8_um_filter_57_21]
MPVNPDSLAHDITQASSRRIAHLDMDAFYASVELLRYPQLKGLPVVIGGGRRPVDEALQAGHSERPLHKIPVAEFPQLKDYTGRGVITTATYAARQFGVGSAMGLMKAAKLCPQAILLPVDFAEIRRYSKAFKAIILDIAPQMEDRGVDEVYIDFTDVPGGQRNGGRVLARLIQKTIFQHTGLTCSVGVAPNKLLAKMASEFNKPNGIAIVTEADLEPMIWPLACRKINGIGPKADEKLQRLGIQTIGELAQQSVDWLIDHFGQKTGAWMFEAARGIDHRPVVLESEPMSISRETTFERDLHAVRDKLELGAIFTRLCEQVAQDLQRKGYQCKTIGIKLRYDDFKSVTRDQTLAAPTGDAATIRKVAGQCLKRVQLQRPLRLLGVRTTSLFPLDGAQTLTMKAALAHGFKPHGASALIANEPQLF